MLWYGEALFTHSIPEPLKRNLFHGFSQHDLNNNLHINFTQYLDEKSSAEILYG